MKRKAASAFTLLEIIVAVAVLGTGLAVILHSFSVAARGVRVARSITQATLLAQAKMAELESISEVEAAETSGDFSPDFPDYLWEAEFSSGEEEEIVTVHLTVFWKEGRTVRKIEFSALRLPSLVDTERGDE